MDLRGRSKAERRVATDGIRTRYPGGSYDGMRNPRMRFERMLRCINLGGTAGIQPVPTDTDRVGAGFFLYPNPIEGRKQQWTVWTFDGGAARALRQKQTQADTNIIYI